MEQTAVQLMSRKQRAAKLLTGDIGLTGLDALTEGEGGFEEALLEAIGRDETLLDPTELFKAEAKVGEIDQEDAAYWNVEEVVLTGEDVTLDESDVLITAALELDATITPIERAEHREPPRRDHQREVPQLQHPTSLLHHHRVHERGHWEQW